MQNLNVMQKIGSSLYIGRPQNLTYSYPIKGRRFTTSGWIIGKSFILFLILNSMVLAAGTEFYAQINPATIGLDQNVELSLILKSDGSSGSGKPEFEAPDFEIVNEFSSMSSSFSMSMGNSTSSTTHEITEVLRPKTTGHLKITNIRISIGGKILRAHDVLVEVKKAGTVLPPSSSQSRRSMGQPLGQPARPSRKSGRIHAFLKAEIGKRSSFYKGEQIVVSYYLYHQNKAFNLQVEKFPSLQGFLKEDLQIPVIAQRLGQESAIVGGVLYDRSLLAQYAIYPLHEGALSIDPMALAFNYYQGGSGITDEEDPFFGFGFFRQMAPQIWKGESEPIKIQVLPLPEAGRPTYFSGGVGNFNVVSAIDKYEVHANEALTLTVKIDGNGNLAAVQEPKVKWPENLELYDTKGKNLGGEKGIQERIFEFLIIPRVPGNFTLPILEFSFFDPEKKQYYTKTTETLNVRVLGPAPGTSLVVKSPSESQKQPSVQAEPSQEPKGLKEALTSSIATGRPIWQYLYWSCLLLLGFFFFLVGRDVLRKRTLKKRSSIPSVEVKPRLSKEAPWQEVMQAYDLLCRLLLDALEERYKVGVHSRSRSELQELLVGQKGLSQAIWERVVRFLEFVEMIQFSQKGGGPSEALARSEYEKWLEESRLLEQDLKSNPQTGSSVASNS